MLENKTISKIEYLNSSNATFISFILNEHLNKFYHTGYILNEAFTLAYSKYVKILIEITNSSDISKRNKFINEINLFDTYVYDHYGCRAQFIRGYNQALKDFTTIINFIYPHNIL